MGIQLLIEYKKGEINIMDNYCEIQMDQDKFDSERFQEIWEYAIRWQIPFIEAERLFEEGKI